jgi:hypothetical protein
MPKAPVDKNCHAVSREQNVRLAGNILPVEPKSKASFMDRAANAQLA